MQLELVYFSGGLSSTAQFPMPDAIDLELSPVFSDVGVVKFKYPLNGLNAAYVKDGSEFGVFLDGVEIPNTRFILRENGIDEAAESKEYDCQGNTLLDEVQFSIVYPPGAWTDPTESTYTNCSVGKIMRDQFSKAQARGTTMTGFTYGTFGDTLDSFGNAWTKQVTMTFDAGVSLLSMLQYFVQQGAVEVALVGRDIRLYNPGTMGTDWTVSKPQMVLRKGRDVKDSPRKTMSKELATAIFIQGNPGVYVERTDSGAIALYGRREVYANQSGLTDVGTMQAYGDAALATRSQPRVEKTHGLVFADQGVPKPFVDFQVGDWLYSDTNGLLERMRVKQWTLKQEADGSISGSVVLNDLFADTVEKMVKRIEGITGGSVSGSSTTSGPQDITWPATPSTPTFSSAVFNDAQGAPWSQITASWAAILTNSDGTTIVDFDHYTVQYGFGTSPTVWGTIYNGADLTCQFSPIKCNSQISLRVAAYDKSGHFSGWSPLYTNYTAADSTPPGQPSTPTVTSRLGILYLAWDGLIFGGDGQPTDYNYTEIHISTAGGFTPSAATLSKTVRGRTEQPFVGLAYGTTYYFRLISRDFSGNASVASVEVSAAPVPLVRTDIGAGSITYNEIAYTDVSNYVQDGSFENAVIRAARSAATVNTMAANNMSWAQTNKVHGDWYLLATGNATGTKVFDIIPLADAYACVAGEKFYARVYSRRDAATVASSVLSFDFLLQNGTTSSVTVDVLQGSDATWSQKEGTATAPTNAVSVSVRWVNTAHTAGLLLLDAVEIRKVMSTVLIDDAAITNAKIGNLAVNDAKINDLSVAKITAGTLSAAVILSGSIKTATTGARVEVDANGVRLYDTGGNNTVTMDSTTGNVTIVGKISTAASGQRIVIDTASGTNSIQWFTGNANETVNGSISAASYGSFSTGGGVRHRISLTFAAPLVYTTGYNGAHIVMATQYIAGGTTPGPASSIMLAAENIALMGSGESVANCDIVAGQINTTGELLVNGNIRVGGQATYWTMLYNDNANFYILVSTAGTRGANFNGLRPFSIDFASGLVGMSNGVTISGAFSVNNGMTLASTGGITAVWHYNNTSASAANVFISSAGIMYRSTASSRRYKKDIAPLTDPGLDPQLLLGLPVRQFRYRPEHLSESDDRFGLLLPGFIADEVAEIYPIAADLEDGVPEQWSDKYIIPGMLALTQQLWRKVEDLQAEVAALTTNGAN